jgi:hypothetical protein
MINKNIKREDVLKALAEIDKSGVPANRKSRKFNLIHNHKTYPPKYVLSLANFMANKRELDPEEFGGGLETNNFLTKLGFEIREGRENISEKKSIILKDIPQKKSITLQKLYLEDHVTALIKNMGNVNNDDRFELLGLILNKMDSSVISLTLPAGFLTFRYFVDKELNFVSKEVTQILKQSERNIAVCFGIDVGKKGLHQLGVAISQEGILGMGRKFFPTPEEKHYIDFADSITNKEMEFNRIFTWKNKNYFLAICYDSFGIKRQKLPEIKIDYVINMIHGFKPKGDGNSGEVYFAKHGIAGASKHWNCASFASAVFFNREIPEKWPSGVIWTKGSMSTQLWKYDDNPLLPFKIERIISSKEEAELRYFKV